MDGKSCCAPPRGDPPKRPSTLLNMAQSDRPEPHRFGVVDIPGGRGLIGTDHPILQIDGEGPCRVTKLKPFRIMATAVTNAQFADFVATTGYQTDAEQFGWSFVFHAHVPDDLKESRAVAQATWWRRIDGADWRNINGPGTSDAWHGDHPVVHVSWNDAKAFSQWAGGRLPTEAEWEHAARGGLGDVPFPWGATEPDDISHHPCNIFQGRFPDHDAGLDGYTATAPAQSFEPNDYGLYNMCGNTWEWTAEPFKIRSLTKTARAQSKQMVGNKVTKGGSFLCHKSYCYRYRIAARTGNTPDSSTAHQGMRLVFDH